MIPIQRLQDAGVASSARWASAVLWLILGLSIPLALNGAGSGVADRWLEASARSAAESRASGVYGSYALARIALEQARVFALRGEVSATESRLPDLERSRPEWSSDGGGMVRALSFMQDMQAVRQTLVKALASQHRIDEAFAYAHGPLNAIPEREGWQWLGDALAGQVEPSDPRIAALSAEVRRRFEAGLLRAALARGDDATIRTLIARWPAGEIRWQAINALAFSLMLDGQMVSTQHLYRIAVDQNPDSGELLMQAASNAIQAGNLDAALPYLARMPTGSRRDQLEAATAFALLQVQRRDDAARLFDTNDTHQARRWEQVALALNRVEWLESYYLAIADPWRRAERLYQLARHVLRGGDHAQAARLANLADNIGASIKSDSTRWLVHAAVAEILAATGDLARASLIAARIPASGQQAARQRAQAAGAIAAAWARSGNAARAIAVADNIDNPALRAGALGRAAIAAPDKATETYMRIIEAAREACRSVAQLDAKSRDDAWAALIQQQLQAGDSAGAVATAEAAQQAGSGAVAWETLLARYLRNGDFAAAQQAVQRIPNAVDPQLGDDRRQRAQVELIEAMAAAGQAHEAMTLLATLDKQYDRERASAAIAQGLATAGAHAEALTLLARVRRDDLREAGINDVLRAMLQSAQLPDAKTVMQLVPERRAAALCWVVAAATAHTTAEAKMQVWLAALPGPLCRAFAYAGAAYSVTAPANGIDVQTLLDSVDPRLLMQGLERAMRKRGRSLYF